MTKFADKFQLFAFRDIASMVVHDIPVNSMLIIRSFTRIPGMPDDKEPTTRFDYRCVR